jgi:signal transduction histidine kinase
VLGPDGVERIVQSQSDVERDANGMPVRFFGTVLDVTERRRVDAERLQLLAEQSARAQAEAAQERFAFLAEASTRLASSLDYEVTLRNVAELAVPTLADACTVDMLVDDAQVRRVATTSGDTKPDDELDRAWTPDFAPEPLVRVLDTGRSALYHDLDLFEGEVLSGLRALGIRSMMVVPLLARGRVLGAITCFGFAGRPAYTSIEQALAEELGRRCGLAIDNARLHAEAQRATRLRDEFLSVAAHELKTPMTTLRGYAQLLGRALLGGEAPTPALLARSVKAIDAQSEKLVTLTEQLLDVSRIEAGKLRLERRTVDLVELVGGIVSAIQETTDRHTLTFTAHGAALLLVDPMRLEQVVSNLVGNAVKYSPHGGPISVVLEHLESGGVRLEVRDWGLGIPPERRESLFDRFYQAHGDGHFGGLGLGLYVSKQIVELHGGSIEAEFPSDGGCQFVVTLPEASSSSRDAA